MKLKNSFRFAIFASLQVALLGSCVRYKQGAFTKPDAIKNIPELRFQTKIFYVNPPINIKIGDSAKEVVSTSPEPEAQQCAKFSELTWRPNLSTPPAETKSLPSELRDDPLTIKNPKIHRRSKTSHDEFTMTSDDVSIYRNNPNPLEVLESLNIFSPDVFPKKISATTHYGHTPTMLMQYVKYLNDQSQSKITSVLSVNKISGGFYGVGGETIKNPSCSEKVVSGIDYGAGISVAIMMTFKNQADRDSFQTRFGEDAPFSLKDGTVLSDEEMSDVLTASQVKIEMSVAQIGGDLAKSRDFVSKLNCDLSKLGECRKARRDIIRYFFNEELEKPSSPTQTNGWMIANANLTPISALNIKSQ